MHAEIDAFSSPVQIAPLCPLADYTHAGEHNLAPEPDVMATVLSI